VSSDGSKIYLKDSTNVSEEARSADKASDLPNFVQTSCLIEGVPVTDSIVYVR
jgi:hypothetical protein